MRVAPAPSLRGEGKMDGDDGDQQQQQVSKKRPRGGGLQKEAFSGFYKKMK